MQGWKDAFIQVLDKSTTALSLHYLVLEFSDIQSMSSSNPEDHTLQPHKYWNKCFVKNECHNLLVVYNDMSVPVTVPRWYLSVEVIHKNDIPPPPRTQGLVSRWSYVHYAVVLIDTDIKKTCYQSHLLVKFLMTQEWYNTHTPMYDTKKEVNVEKTIQLN